jgi:MFS family permease
MFNNFYKMKQGITNNQEEIELKQKKLSKDINNVMNNDNNLHNIIEKDTNTTYVNIHELNPNINSNEKKVIKFPVEDNRINTNLSASKKNKKKKKAINFNLIDSIIDDVGITWYHLRIYLILSLFFLADGAEMIVISLLIKQMGKHWNLNASEKGFTGSVVFIGFFIGALVSGKISDTHGRKPVFVVGSLLVCVFSVASAFANNFTTFLILRALNGFGIGISIPSSSSLAAEITPTNYRSWVLNLVWVFFPFGEIFATIIAKNILKTENGWRYLLGFAALPTVLSAIICFFIFESPRFYFTIRNYDKAFQGLERMIEHRKNKLIDVVGNNFSDDSKPKDANNEIYLDANNKFNDTNSEDNHNKNVNNEINDIEKNPNQNKRENSQDIIFQDGDILMKNPYKDNLNKYLTLNNKINDEGRKIIIIENEKEDEIKPEFKTLLKKRYIYLTFLCCLIFYVCSFVYYGLIYILPQTIVYVDPKDLSNSTLSNNLTNGNYSNNYNITINKNLEGLKEQENEDEMYRGVILSALSEIPSTILTGFIGNMPFFGRKGSLLYGFILSGISALLCSMFMKNLTIFATALKFSIGIPYGVIYLYVSEAFPTKIRTISLGVTNSFNRLGGISTPIISQLAFSAQANNPYKIYSLICFLAAIFSYLLPFETLGRTIR